MTTKVIVTEAQIRRAIKAAQKEGLPIAGVRTDGTVIIGEPSPPLSPAAPSNNEDDARWLDRSKWLDKPLPKKTGKTK